MKRLKLLFTCIFTATLLIIMMVAPAASLSNSATWTKRYNGPGNRDDWGVGSVADASKTYVVGTSMGGSIIAPTNNDYVVFAYTSSNGNEAWSARYDAGSTDEAAAIALSPDGTKVFVTGASTGTGSGFDYATIAYSTANGSQLWVARYNGPANGFDKAYSVTVSPDGSSVYVTGESAGSGSDYATVAYSASNGSQQWLMRHNGTGNGNDVARTITADSANVYISGQSASGSSAKDYLTVAYSRSSGTQLWTSSYNGPANGDDGAWSIAVNGSSIFVTGESNGSGSGNDYATIAYDTGTGMQQWASRHNGSGNGYDGAFAIAASPDGRRVYVTGGSTNAGSGLDYGTLAYDASDGEQLWLKTYNGSSSNSDYATAIKLSPDGSRIYVTGNGTTGNGPDFVTLAYYATGYELWSAVTHSNYDHIWQGNTLSINPDGSRVFITGGSTSLSGGYDVFTASYNTATGTEGSSIRTNRYDGPAHKDDRAHAIAVSPDSNRYYVTGSSCGPESQFGGGGFCEPSDMLTIAYDATNGNQLWTARYSPGVDVRGFDIKTSPDGSKVYITGGGLGLGNGPTGYITIAYDAFSGQQIWFSEYKPADTYSGKAIYLAVGSQNDRLYVAGNTCYNSSGCVPEMAALDAANGNLVWATFGGPTYEASWGQESFDQPMALNSDGSRLYATSMDSAFSVYDTSNGGLIFAAQATGLDTFVSNSIAVNEDSSSVFVTGRSNDFLGRYLTTIAFDGNNGNQIWSARYQKPDEENYYFDWGQSIAISPDNGTVYIAGYTSNALLSMQEPLDGDYITLAYSASGGNQLWSSRYDGGNSGNDYPTSMALSAGGDRVYITGQAASRVGINDFGQIDYLTIALDASGNQKWSKKYNGPGNNWDQAWHLALSPNGSRLYVTGESMNSIDRISCSIGVGTCNDFATQVFSAL